MKFETKFNFHDRVWHIWQNQDKKWIDCSFCGGTGSITGVDQKKRMCPDCYGGKGKHQSFALKWMVRGQLTIGKINIEATAKSDGLDPNSIFTNFGPQRGSYKESYMCLETGIGSGTIYYAETLFRTEEEAQDECDKRNIR
jgi:hypothetical protein